MSGVKDFSHAFSKHRDETGGTFKSKGNLKAVTFSGTGVSKWTTTSVTSLDSTFEGASKMNVDLSTWNVAKVTTLQDTFKGAIKFAGTGLDLWNVAKVTSMMNTFNNAASLASCNKRKITDAWKGNSVFVATTYDTDWAGATCPVRLE